MKLATSLLAFAAIAAASLSGAAASLPRVHPSVHRALRSQGTVNIFVTLKAGTDNAINAVQEAEYATRGQKVASLVTSLENNAAASQTEVASLLVKEAAGDHFTKTQSFWISNQIFIENATIELVEKLAALPSIAEITEEEVIQLDPIVAATVAVDNSTVAEWGVSKIGAPAVWAAGNLGEGVIVATIDTGVLGTHEALAANFRNDGFSWYDPESKKTAPYDNNGHGTHTMGTIAGNNGIGVAPNAKWIACKGCRTSSCPQSDLLACFQFMTCPTNPAGTVKDCTKAPHLVSNSWGGGQGSTTYSSAITAWRTAGIIPIFANGNAGPSCRTANSPGDNANVIAVGATDVNDALASFSSKGPSVGGLVKPEVSAPGVAVRSSWYTGNSGYNSISGTSMATPHVAGTVALLVSAKPGLSYAQAKDALTKTTSKALQASGYTCGSTADSVWPNNQFGHGRIDAEAAVAYVKAL